MNAPQKLQCPVKHYPWGERASDGETPLIPRLLHLPAEQKPWAELWIGAHPSDSAVLSDGKTMAQYLAENNKTLPFLLKILCCARPLSIQSHPDKQTAERLHREYPKDFPDANHKPEVLLALSDFRMMAGFRSPLEIDSELASHPSLMAWRLGGGSLKKLCQSLFSLPDTILAKMQEDLLREIAGSRRPSDLLFRELSELYPGDAGCFFAYLLNVMTLSAGEAVFLPANTPHAYLHGEGIECMANSDNVIRAGLTSKKIHTELLMDTLRFETTKPEQLRIPSKGPGFEFSCDDFRLTVLDAGVEEKTTADTVYCVLDGNSATAWYAKPGTPVALHGEKVIRVTVGGMEKTS